MIKFFNRIRFHHLGTGKTRQYIKYAIGEILLVVIGILLALTVNNWNEERKTEFAIADTLSELRSSFLKDSTFIAATILEMEANLHIQREVVHRLSLPATLDSSITAELGKCMVINEMRIATAGYEKLKEFGLTNLKNKSLENSLIRYYDIIFTGYQEEVENDKYDFRETWLPYVRQHCKDYEYGKFAVPKDYEQLSSDPELFILLKTNVFNRQKTLDKLRYMQQTNQMLLAGIKHHLNP